MTARLCTYGPPAERKRTWVIKFEDADMGDMFFTDEKEALETFDRASLNWNCTLFETVLRLPERGANDWDHRAM